MALVAVAKSSPPKKKRAFSPPVSVGAVVKITELEPTPERSKLEPLLAKLTEAKVRLEPLPEIVMAPSMELTVRAPVTSAVVLPTISKVPPVMVTVPVLKRRSLLFAPELDRRRTPPAVVAILPAPQAPVAPLRIVVPRLAVRVPVALFAPVKLSCPAPCMFSPCAPVPVVTVPVIDVLPAPKIVSVEAAELVMVPLKTSDAPPESSFCRLRLAPMVTAPLNSMDLLPSSLGERSEMVVALVTVTLAGVAPTRKVPPCSVKGPAPNGVVALSRMRMPSTRVVLPV